jgi:hypothetical protein
MIQKSSLRENPPGLKGAGGGHCQSDGPPSGPCTGSYPPVELSAGTRPRKDISCLGVSRRRTSPISAARVTATRNDAPRSLHDRRHGPLRKDEGELLLERAQTLKRLSATGKKLPIVVAAIALAAFLWAIGREIAPA